MRVAKILLMLLCLLIGWATSAQPPNWDLSNTYWNTRMTVHDPDLGDYYFDGFVRFDTENFVTGAITGRTNLPPNLNPLGQYDFSGFLRGDSLDFSGIARLPHTGYVTVHWSGQVLLNGTRLQGSGTFPNVLGDEVPFDWVATGAQARRLYRVGGQITYEGFVGNPNTIELRIERRNPGSTNPIQTYVIHTDSNGNYQITVPQGTYDFAFYAPRWLRLVQRNVTVSGNITNLNAILTNGDITLDNRVDNSDLSVLLAQFGTSTSDLTGDDLTGDNDLYLALLNFGLQGDP